MKAGTAGTTLGYGRIVGQTDKAIRVVIDASNTEHWIPKSQIHAESEVYDRFHDEGKIVVNAWFAKDSLEF